MTSKAQFKKREWSWVSFKEIGAVVFFALLLALPVDSFAACGGTVRQWTSGGGNDNWSTTTNWSGNNVPNGATEDARIIAGQRDTQMDSTVTIGCMEIVSGLVTDANNVDVTIVGDYFRNLTVNSLTLTTNNFWFIMQGSAAQTFENVDTIRNLEINNNTSVTFTNPFTINRNLTLNAGWTGTLYINSDLNITATNAITIPAGATVVVGPGAVVTTAANWTINGTLKIMPGGQFRPQNGTTITVNSGASLRFEGADGNPAVLSSQTTADRFTLNIAGNLNANYFVIQGLAASGVNMTAGAIQKLDNGSFQNAINNGSYVTIAAGVSLPTTFNSVGFMNGLNVATVRNFSAGAYNGSTVTVNNWTGSKGGAGFELDTNNKINWGTQAGTKLVVTDNSNPPATLAQSASGNVATFGFSLNQSSTATSITALTVSMVGTASSTDVQSVNIFYDAPASRNCTYTAGTDTGSLTGGAVQLVGSPPAVSVTIPAGTITTAGDNDVYCIHVVATVSATARDAKTIQFSIQNTADVTNSQSYTFGSSGTPPVVSNPNTEITGDAVRKWEGTNSSTWTTNANWTGGVPTSATDAEVGLGERIAQVTTNPASAQNLTLKTGGTMDWNSTSNVVDVYSELDVETGHVFSNATSGVINIRGANSQSVKIRTEFPGNVTINNSGAAGNDIVAIDANSTIGGTLTLSDGYLRINSPNTLTVRGNFTCANGTTVEIKPGATLALGNNAVFNVQAGCTLIMVGTPGNNSIMTSDNASSKYTVTMAGTIQARYYTFSRLGVNGLTISGSINATNHLQDGLFTTPVLNNSTFLRTSVQIPTNTLNNMTFSLGGSSATGTKNIDTTGAAAGTLTLDNYSGDLAGLAYDTDPTYLLSWLGSVNTINLTQEATNPSTLNAGTTYNMGRFGFQQTFAGASYVDTDITTLKITLSGTASANDISNVDLFYDSNCDGVAGTLIGSGTFSGSPATKTFSISGGAATIPADVSSPPKRCIYAELTVAPGATGGNTAGIKIAANSDVVNSQSYQFNAATQPPITSGTAGTIVGSTSTTWLGGTSTAWGTAANWSNGVPSATKDCIIDDGPNDPVQGAGTITCKNLTIGNGTLTLTNGSGAVLEVYGSFTNSGTFNQNNCTLRLRDDGVTATNQGVSSSTAITALTFNKTAGGEVYVASSALTITTLTLPVGSNFTFSVPNGKTLSLGASLSYSAGTLSVEAGGTLKMANSTTLTVNSGATLKMVGDATTNAIMTSTAGANSYNVVVNGTIKAQYYTFDHLNVNGVGINSGATIDGTNHLQDGTYSCPKVNSATLLKLARQVPTNTMNNMKFQLLGCGVTGTKNIDTTGASAGTLVLNSYSGDLSGPSFDTDPTYLLSWTGAQNTIDISATTATGGMNASSTYNMGRFNFTQTQAGTFANADINSLKVTLTGTAAATDIDAVRIYYDSGCTGTGGTLIGSGVFAGSPASKTFSIAAAAATVQFNVTTPPTRCIYVEYDISGGAVNGVTAGAEISSSSHVSNDQGWLWGPSTTFPVSLGAARTIAGATVTTWTGATNTTWGTAGNWSGGLPDNTKNCVINDVANDPIVTAGTVACKAMTINTGGSVTINNGTVLEVYDNLSNSGTISHVGTGALRIMGTGTNIITSSAALTSLSFGKTAGTASVGSTNLLVNAVSFQAGANFTLSVPDGKTLTFPNSVTFAQTSTLYIEPGGTVKMGGGTTLQFDTPSTLKMIGTSSKRSTLSSSAGSSAYNVVINTGTIQAQYYSIDHLNTNGLTINSGATIDSTYHLQDGEFLYPVNNSSTFLKLARQVPTNTMNNMRFDLNGSGATGTKNVDTTGAGAGTLTINAFTGNVSGPTYDTDPTYLISWTGALNTINLTQDAVGPSSLDAGSTYVMGRFGFTQTLAGASYANTDITSLKLTLIGTATASDIAAVKIYYETDCNSTGGALIGSGTFSGSPLTKTFTIAASDATVPSHATTPPKVCIYVTFDIAGGATNANTAGVRITASADVVTSQSYTISPTTPPPVTLGTAGTIVGATTTDWTGTTSTDWFVASNWSNGIPDATKSCQITNLTNDPNVNGGSGTARCKNFINIDGIVTLQNATSAVLEVYGNYNNTGTLTQNNGTLRMVESGTASTQTFYSSSNVTALTFNKTLGGTVSITNSLTITTLTMPAGQTFELKIPSGVIVTTTNGPNVVSGTLTLEAGGTLRIPNGQTFTVSGGTFKTTGVNDAWGPQNTTNKGKITNNGAGTYTFNCTAGTLDLTGFIIDALDVNGVNMSGSCNLLNLDGGQFTNLPNTTNAKALQINKSSGGTITETTPTNVGFMWGAANSTCAGPCIPTAATTYYTVYAPNCGGAMTLTFSEWFGNFTMGPGGGAYNTDTETKIYDTTEAGTCNVVMAAAASPVSLVALTATPYDNAVSIDWRTGSELNHQGFNVYRSMSPSNGYIQINAELIRNFYSSTSFQGVYRFVDTSVLDGLTYYYKVEDVAVNGAKVMHGPVTATPEAGLGAPPADPSNTNSGDTEAGSDAGNAPAIGSIGQPGLVDLGNGVHILSQTQNSLRVEIIPPTETWAASSWNGAYETLSVPGYSKMTVAGRPELVERTILIEVGNHTTATVSDFEIVQAVNSSHVVAPAPEWTLDGANVLQPSWSPHAATYMTSALYPNSNFYEVASDIKTINGNKYVEIHVVPFLYNPGSSQVQQVQKITLDIGLDGIPAWTPPTTDADLALSPASVDGVLRVRYNVSGMYEVSYDDMRAAGVEGPFKNVDVNYIRGYYHGEEIPIRIISGNGNFASGDKIYFYGLNTPSLEDEYDEVVLAPFNVMGSASAASRMDIIDADPTSYVDSTESGTFTRKSYEDDVIAVFDQPLGDFTDHLYWTRIYRPRGNYSSAPPISSYFDLTANLTGLLQNSPDAVQIRVDVRGKAGNAQNSEHHLVVYVNSLPYEVGDVVFEGNKPQTISFAISPAYFFSGINTIRFQVVADRVPVGDYDIVDINKIDIDYRANRRASSGVAEVFSKRPDTNLSVTNFPPPGNTISVYDVSRRGNRVSLLSNVEITSPDGGATYTARFAGRQVAADTGRYFIAISDGSYLEPKAMVLNYGSGTSLRSTSNGADLIIIGSRELLDAAEELTAHRRQNGLRVVEAPLHQLFAEFGHGRASSQAIKDFITYALANWQTPAPKYLLLLGDSTYDPKNRLSYGVDPHAVPIPIQEGTFIDFGNDHWFVADDSNMPKMAVGRLPTSKPNEIEDYVQKVIAYESGSAAPIAQAAANAVFVSDSETMSEGFGLESDSLAVSMKTAAGHFTTQRVVREGQTDAQTKSNIVARFNEGPLMVTYLGHGASDRWAGASVFTVSDAKNLSNDRLPIVTALNCMNTYFYDADPDEKSLAETLVFNPNGGAIAFWGSTGMTAPPVQVNLAKNFINEIGTASTQAVHTVRIGDLMLRSKVSLGSEASQLDTLRSYSLIGDPSIKLPSETFKAPQETTLASNGDGGGGGGGGGGMFGCGSTGDGSGAGGAGFGLEMTLLALMFMLLKNLGRQTATNFRTKVRATYAQVIAFAFEPIPAKLTLNFAFVSLSVDPPT